MKTAPRWIPMLVLLGATPCLACYNDSYTQPAEEEFRSQYKTTSQPSPADKMMVDPWAIATMCFGSALIGAAVMVVFNHGQQKSK